MGVILVTGDEGLRQGFGDRKAGVAEREGEEAGAVVPVHRASGVDVT